RNSSHPLSIQLVNWLQADSFFEEIQGYREFIGKGLQATIDGEKIKIGSASFTDAIIEENTGSRVYINIDGKIRGYFQITQPWRSGLPSLINNLESNYDIHLISGDQDKDRLTLQEIFTGGNMHFNQTPKEKLQYIQHAQRENNMVCMIGDGLNDAGALKQADFGIAISDDINSFSPGCDAILEGKSLINLPKFFNFAKDSMKVIYMSFGISLMYNIVGLSFAVQGTMSP